MNIQINNEAYSLVMKKFDLVSVIYDLHVLNNKLNTKDSA